MTELYMKRAARAAGGKTRAIAIYAPNTLPDTALASLVLTAAFSASLWAFFLLRTVILTS